MKEWKTFGLKRQSSFMPTVCHLCLIIIQHNVNSVWHWSVSGLLPSKNHKRGPHRHPGSESAFPVAQLSHPCSFSYHKTKILEPASAISWVCHLYASTLPLLQGTEWRFDAAPLLLPLWFSRKLISASFTPRSSHSESQCFLKGKGEGFLFLHYLARLVVCFPHPWTISGSQ